MEMPEVAIYKQIYNNLHRNIDPSVINRTIPQFIYVTEITEGDKTWNIAREKKTQACQIILLATAGIDFVGGWARLHITFWMRNKIREMTEA